jgi:Flp pilus assembly protein TadG
MQRWDHGWAMSKNTAGDRAQAGQTLVEFAIVLPIVVVLLVGTLDFARAIFIYNTLSEGARQGARVAIVNQDTATIAATAVDYSPSSGLTTADVSACFKTPASLLRDCAAPTTDRCQPLRPGCLAIVTAQISYTPITPVLGQIIGSFPLTSTSISPIESACISGCP